MKRYRRVLPLILAALLIVLVASKGQAISTLFHTYSDACEKAYAQGHYIEAEHMGQAAIREADAGGIDEVAKAASMVSLANCYMAEAKFAEAEPLFRGALSIYDSLQQPSMKRGLLCCLNDFAALYHAEGNYAQSQSLYQRALKLTEQSPEAGGEEYIAAIHNNLANVMTATGNMAEAAPLYVKALSYYDKIRGGENLDAAMASNNLGLLYLRQGDHTQAEPLTRRAIDLRERLLPLDHPDLAGSLNNLGLLLSRQGKYAEAEVALRRAQPILEKMVGTQHPDYARCISNLAECGVREGKYDYAEDLYKKALSAQESKSTSSTLDVCSTLGGLCDLYVRQGRAADAESTCNRLLALTDQTSGAGSAQSQACHEALAVIAKAKERDKPAIAIMPPNAPPRKTGSSIVPKKKIRDKWAVIIGISKYKDGSMTLRYASKDANDFSTFLIKEGHFSPDHVLILTDEKATRENILATLGDRWLPRLAAPDDLVLIYISSHGTASTLDLGGLNYIVAFDTYPHSLYATGIPIQNLTKIIKERVHCNRVILILDACHSGAATADKKGLIRTYNYDASAVSQDAGQLVICSSKPDQVSWESAQYPNSVFTHCLIEALRLKGNDTLLADAYQYLKNKVQAEVLHDRGELQTPVLSTPWQEGDLLISAPPTEPTAVPPMLQPVFPAVPQPNKQAKTPGPGWPGSGTSKRKQ